MDNNGKSKEMGHKTVKNKKRSIKKKKEDDEQLICSEYSVKGFCLKGGF